MTGNVVETTIKVNVQAENNTKDTIQAIVNQFNGIEHAINDAMNNPMNRSAELMNDISKAMEHMVNSIGSLEGVVPAEQINNAVGITQQLIDKFRQLMEMEYSGNIVHTTDIQSQMQEIGDLYNNIQNRIKESYQNIGNVSKESLTELESDIEKTIDKILSIFDNLSSNQQDNAISSVEKLKQAYQELNSIVEVSNLKQEQYGYIKDPNNMGSGLMQELLKNSKFHTEDNTEQLRKEEEERQKLIDKINEEYEAKRRLEELNKAYSGQWDLNNTDLYKNVATPSEEMVQSLDILKDKPKEAMVDIEKLKEALSGIASSGKLSKDSITQLASAFGASAKEIGVFTIAVTALVAEFKLFKKIYDDTISGLKEMGESTFDGVQTSAEFLIDTFGDVIDTVDELIESLREFADVGKEIQEDYFTLYSYLGKEAGDSVNEFANSLERIYGLDATTVIADMNKIVISASKLGASKDDIDDITASMYMLAQNLKVVANTDLNKVINDLSTVINTGNVGRTSSLYSLFNKDEIEQLKKLNTEAERWNYIRNKGINIEDAYEKYLNTEAGKLEQLNEQWGSFMGNIGQLALGIYAKVAPILTALLQLANNVLNSIMGILNINVTSGTSDYTDGIVDGLGDVADGYDKVAESAKNANKQVMGFDDVNQTKDNSNEGTNSSSNINFDLNSIINDTALLNENIQNLGDRLKELLNNKDYFGAGSLIADTIKNALVDIPWDDIQSNLYDTSKAFSEFINGLFADTDLGDEIGSTLAEAINTGILSLESLGENIDFSNIGKFLGESWNGFWKGLKTDDLANTVMNWFVGLFETINGFLSDNPFENTGKTLADLINSFFFGGTNSVTGEETLGLTSERMDEIVDGIIGFINELFEGIGTFLDNVNLDGIKEKLKELVTKLMTSFAENSSDWGATLNELISTILTLASDLLSTADKEGLKQGISDFLWNLDLGELVSQYTHLQLQLWWIEFRSKLTAFGSSFAQFIGDGIEKIWQLIQAILALIGVGILKGIEWISQKVFELSDNFRTWAQNLGTEIGNFLGKIIGIILGGIVNIINSIRNSLNVIWQNITNWFESIWDTVTGWVDAIKDVINDMLGGLSDIKANITTTWSNSGWNPSNWNIPFLATGGIVNRATPVITGEAGREAILPLENNTGWMDELAAALVSKMSTNNNSGSSNITIDMSGYSKNFYTRNEMLEFGKQVVEALKLYGVNVSTIY